MNYGEILITKFEGGIKNASNGNFIPISQALEEIETGKYREKVHFLRTFRQSDQPEDKKTYQREKGTLDYYCFMCQCHYRSAKNVTSEDITPFFIADLDDIDQLQLETIKDELRSDPHVYCFFESPSGSGLKVIYVYDNKRYSVIDAFYEVSDRIFKNHSVYIDPSGKDIVRACFVSHDEEIYINEDVTPIEITGRTKDNYEDEPIIAVSDIPIEKMRECVEKIQNEGINITESYEDWVYVGLILASNYGESGRELYHRISSNSSKYDFDDCDKKYDNLVKTYRKRLNPQWILCTVDFENYGDSLHFKVTNYLRKLGIYYNELRNRYEWPNGVEFTTRDFNTQFFLMKDQGIKGVTKTMFEMVIGSGFIDCKNPLRDLYDRLIDNFTEDDIDAIDDFVEHITFEFTEKDESEYDFFRNIYSQWIIRWLLQIPAAIQGKVPELCLVLMGKQGNGKTELFFRMLLPEMKKYYSTNTLDGNPKDALIALTENLIILDDEFSGKSKREASRWKATLSTRYVSVRRPYSKNNEQINRIAVFCGTSNDYDIIYDRTGNRRILPIPMDSRDFAAFDKLDKEKLWRGIFGYWHHNRESHKLTRSELDALWRESDNYTVINQERDMLMKYFENADDGDGQWMTASDMQSLIQNNTNLRLEKNALGREATKLFGSKRHIPKSGGSKGYYIKEREGKIADW